MNKNNSTTKVFQLTDKASPIKSFERVQTKHRNSIQHSRIGINTQAMQTLNNEALRVKDLLSCLLENADPEDKKVYDIDHELKRINESRNATMVDEFIGFKLDIDAYERVPTKGASPVNQRKDDSPSSFIRFKSSKGIKKSKYNNCLNPKREDSMKQLEGKILLMKENSAPTIDIPSRFKRRDNRRQSFQTKTPDFFNKLLLRNSKDYENDNDTCNNNNSNNNIRSNKKHSTILLKRRQSPNDDITLNKKGSKIIDETEINLKGIDNNHNNTNDLLKETTSIEGNKLQDLIPLNNSKIKAFDSICSDIKDSIIMSPNILKKVHSENTNNNLLLAKNTATINNQPNDIIDDAHTSDDEPSLIRRRQEIKEIKYRCLERQNKLVYDSLSDEEVDDEILGVFYFHPASFFKIGFDFILILLTLYGFIITPLSVAFDFYTTIPITSWRYILELIIDIVYGLDLITGFFTAFFDFEEQLITRNKPIAKYYLCHGFAVDFICALPFNTFLLGFTKRYDNLIYTFISDNHELIHFTRLFRIIKIFKVFQANSFTTIAYKALIGLKYFETWSRLWSTLLIFFLLVHFLSCIFIFLGQFDYPNWISVQGLENSTKVNIYLGSCYYICATVFTIGYGDILSVSIYERFYNLFLLIIGIVMYSWAVTSLSNYVQTVDSKTSEYQKNLAILEQIRVTHEKMPHILYDKISRFLTYDYNTDKKDKNEIIQNLPPTLRNTLIIEMYKNIINNFIFFKKFDNNDFIIQVILKLKPMQVIKNEKLVNEGDYIEDIIFVKRGSLALEIPLPVVIKDETLQTLQTMQKKTTSAAFNFTRSITRSVTTSKFAPDKIEYDDYANDLFKKKKMTSTFQTHQTKQQPKVDQQYIKIIEIRRNEHFGDILMFLNKRSPLTVKVRSKVAEIFLLKKTDAVDISMQFPRIWRKIIKNSLFNMEQIERLINKAFKFFYIHNEGNRNVTDKKKNYYHRDYTKKNTMLNSNKIFNNLSNEACELQSIPSSEGQMTNEEEEYTDEFYYDEDSKDNEDGVIPEANQQEEEEEDTRYKKHYDPNAIVEEENDDDEEEEDGNNDNNKSASSDDKTLQIKITNSNADYEDNDEETRGNQTSTTKQINNNKSLLIEEEEEEVSHNNNNLSKEKVTDLLSQVNTLPFSQEEINQENYPYEVSIDLKDNSFITSIMPKDTMSWNFHNDSPNNPNNSHSNSNTNNNIGNNNDNYIQLFNNSSDKSCVNYNKKQSNNKNSACSGILTCDPPKIIFGDLEIAHISSFSVMHLMDHYPISITKLKESIPTVTDAPLISSHSKGKGLESLKSIKSIGKLPIPLRTSTSEIDSPIEQRRNSKMIFYQHKDSFLKEKASPRIKKTNTSAITRKSLIKIPLRKQLSKIPKPNNSTNMLDKISQNIENNNHMLKDPKTFYSNLFSQVKKDGKTSTKVLSKKLTDIMRIIEQNNPNKQKFKQDNNI